LSLGKCAIDTARAEDEAGDDITAKVVHAKQRLETEAHKVAKSKIPKRQRRTKSQNAVAEQGPKPKGKQQTRRRKSTPSVTTASPITPHISPQSDSSQFGFGHEQYRTSHSPDTFGNHRPQPSQVPRPSQVPQPSPLQSSLAAELGFFVNPADEQHYASITGHEYGVRQNIANAQRNFNPDNHFEPAYIGTVSGPSQSFQNVMATHYNIHSANGLFQPAPNYTGAQGATHRGIRVSTTGGGNVEDPSQDPEVQDFLRQLHGRH
jgi:hypothetical protein